MSISPQVELLFHPTDLNPQDLARAGQFLGSPSQAIEAGLGALRLMMVDRMKQELAASTGEMSVSKLVELADLAWSAAFWKFRKISAPVMADAYVRAYRQADAGDVPMALIYDLADKHADRIGDYFHQSSKQAMVEGFNSYVNRRVASKAAANRVLDAYGLTPRQMGGYVSASASMDSKVSSRERRSLKGKVLDYVARSFRKRIKIFADQEEHNIDQQAQQFAWMWLVDKGRLNADAEKIWITAHDEKVCPVCGPLHGQKVGVNEQFSSEQGAFWTPGIHPNCRCHVRLIEHTFRVSKAYVHGQWQEREHPRAPDGEFTTKKKKVTTLERTAPVDAEWLQQMRALARADVLEGQQQAAPALPQLGARQLGAPQLGRRSGLMVPPPAPVAAPVEAPAPPQLGARAPQLGARAPQLGVRAPQLGVRAPQLGAVAPQLAARQQALGILALNRQAMARTEPQTYSMTAAIPGARGENILYYYDPAEEAVLRDQEGKVAFTPENLMLKGSEARVELMHRALEKVNRDINQTVWDVVQNQSVSGAIKGGPEGIVVTLQTPQDFHDHITGIGGGQRFMVTSEELREMITAVALKAPGMPLENKAMWPANAEAQAYSPGPIPSSLIMDMLGIHSSDFEQPIYSMTRAHHEQATPLQTGTRSGFEDWISTGDFKVTKESVQGPIREIEVEPADVPEL